MGMFDNYENVPDNYIPCNRKPDIRPCIPTKPLEIYNAKNEFIGYGWDYGDSIILEFITTGEVTFDTEKGDYYEDAAAYLEGKTFNFKIYNFRYEVVFDATVDAATDVKIEINKENSENLVKGTYTFKLILIGNDTEYSLMDNNTCVLYIK